MYTLKPTTSQFQKILIFNKLFSAFEILADELFSLLIFNLKQA